MNEVFSPFNSRSGGQFHKFMPDARYSERFKGLPTGIGKIQHHLIFILSANSCCGNESAISIPEISIFLNLGPRSPVPFMKCGINSVFLWAC